MALLDAHPTPSGAAHVVPLDQELVYWPALGRPAAVDRFTATILPFVDGKASVLELVEDLASASDLGFSALCPVVLDRLRKLEQDRLIDGLRSATDPPVHRREERLPDGRTVHTVTMRVDQADVGGEELMRSLLTEETFAAELVPAESCLGQKLRLGTEAKTVGIRVEDRVVSVRIGHRPTLDALQARTDLVYAAGPTMAFVSAPHEGCGPPRLYDREGIRVGRPRSADDAADVLGHLLRELAPPGAPPGLVVSATPALRERRCVLLGPQLASAPRIRQRLESKGAHLAPSRRVVLADGRAFVDRPFEHDARQVDLVGIALLNDDPALTPRAQAVTTLLSGLRHTEDQHRVAAMQGVIDAISAVPAVVVARGRDQLLDLSDAAAHLLNLR